MIKPKRVYQYSIHKQADGLFSVIEVSVMENGEGERKRTLYKNLYHSDAENMVHTLSVKRMRNPSMPVKAKRRRYK